MSTRKYPWFKHYNNASNGLSLRTLWDANDMDAYGFYWMLLEMVSRFESIENRGEIIIRHETLRRETGWNSQRLAKVLTKLCNAKLADISNFEENSYKVYLPNWLELQERGRKNTGIKPVSAEQNTGPRIKNKEERIKNKKKSGAEAPEACKILLPDWAHSKLKESQKQLLGRVKKQATLDFWLSNYSQDFLIEEIAKVERYLDENERQIKNVGNFLTGWFERSTNPLKTKEKKKTIDFRNVNWGPVT